MNKNRDYFRVHSFGTTAGFLLSALLICLFADKTAIAQIYPASPSNWLFPDGNSMGTRHVSTVSQQQEIDSMIVKWSTSSISGDVKPLIGNIINNERIFPNFNWGPNEIAAVVGGKMVVVDAAGRTHRQTQPIPHVKSFSLLFDSTSSQVSNNVTMPVVLGVETLEFENHQDSISYCFIAGFNHYADTVTIMKRLAVDLRPYKPNIFASMKPVYAKKDGSNVIVYTTVNMSNPSAPNPSPATPPYFRGLAQFHAGVLYSDYPLPDVGDDLDNRINMGPEVSFAQPSVGLIEGSPELLLPTYGTPSLDVRIDEDSLTGAPSYADGVYLLGFNISGNSLWNNIGMLPLVDPYVPQANSRPQIRPFIVYLTDAYTGLEEPYILIAEEYRGIEGSNGTARLHLFDKYGDPLTMPGDPFAPPFYGGSNHIWSVAVGDVDGIASNKWGTYYPNNPGNEIIVTQSSREFSVAASKLSVLRYYGGDLVEKPTPPNSFLYTFDTVATQRINGWVAAVNDLDGAADGKDEIVLVDGSKLRIMRMKDYSTFEFREGRPFDTVYTHEFDHQTISHVAIADLEGDGKNDLIVTTYDSTYVIGSEILNLINITVPSVQSIPPQEFCAGDEFILEWTNIMRGHQYVSIWFRELINGVPVDTLMLISDEVENLDNTVQYIFTVDQKLLDKEGYFIVESAGNNKIKDSTAIVRFEKPILNLDALPKYEYKSGERVYFTGTAQCVDSISIYYRIDSTEQILLKTDPVSAGNFSVYVDMPCLDIFECSSADRQNDIFLQLVSYRNEFVDSSDEIPINLMPADFPITIEPCTTACTTQEFRWDLDDFDFECDTVYISVSVDWAETFNYIAGVPKELQYYAWDVPIDIPNTVFVRFCCANSCIRTDTVLHDVRPRFVNIIAPNPFNPINEELEIVYEVPRETSVNIKILDQNNHLVAEPVRNAQRNPGISYCDRWNGNRIDGAWADSGVYYVVIEMSDGVKEVYPVFVRK